MVPGNEHCEIPPDDGLPPLSLLDPPATPVPFESPGNDVTAGKIASQFRQRGIDATCVGVAGATRMTTFRFRLAEGGYDQVTKADDLLCRMIAMTTETSGVSIQAPIPDSVDIAVHLPRRGMTEPVRLAPFVEVARRSGYRVPLCLGEDYLGRPRVVDLATECHQLVAGQTGSGKSVFLSSAVLTLTMATTPESVRLVLIDGKGLDLTVFDPLPHNACPVVTEPSQAARTLECLNGEMDRRRQFIRQNSAQDIWTLNERLCGQRANLPAFVLMIDEFQTILSEPNADRLLQRLAQQGRACGIFVILATQRPSVDILRGSTKTNIPGRVCFRLPSQIDSRVVLDQGGAEQLAQPGDLLTVQSSIARPVRLQCPLPSRGEIQRVREYFDNDRPRYIMDLVEAIGDTRSRRIGIPSAQSSPCAASPADPEDRFIRPTWFLPAHIDEETVLRKLKKEFPDHEWSVELVYRPILLAETDSKAHLLYDSESRALVTHLAPWREVEIGRLFDCSDQELRILAALRRMPRRHRDFSEIEAWLGENGHAEPSLAKLVVRGLVGPDYRIPSVLSTAPAVSTKLTTSPLPGDPGQVLAVAERVVAGAAQELRRVLALLWNRFLRSAYPVGLPIYVVGGPEWVLRLSVGREWPWRARPHEMAISERAVSC